MPTTKGAALVTGASAGIGAAYAARLAARGHSLVLVARDEARLERSAERLRLETGVNVEVLPADLAHDADLCRVERRLRAGDVEMLVNNAGVAIPGRMADMDRDQLQAMLLLNVVATTRLAHAAILGMLARGRGTIVNVGSVVGLNADRPGISAAYTATKAYILALSEGLESELRKTGVRVQAVLPGITRTEIWDKASIDVEGLAGDVIMEAAVMVDAALAGLDMGERVTIPALEDILSWDSLKAVRDALRPNLSRQTPAQRYRIPR